VSAHTPAELYEDVSRLAHNNPAEFNEAAERMLALRREELARGVKLERDDALGVLAVHRRHGMPIPAAWDAWEAGHIRPEPLPEFVPAVSPLSRLKATLPPLEELFGITPRDSISDRLRELADALDRLDRGEVPA
jgi:hypothetical protein